MKDPENQNLKWLSLAWVFTFDHYQYLTGRNEKTVNWISGVNLTEGKYYTYQMISLYGNLKFRCVTWRFVALRHATFDYY